MKRILIVFLICISMGFSSLSFAIDSKMKVIGTMASYGVVGGALLGTASLAFGTSGRAIAKGASLGLYAGLIFGTYIITSYELKKRGFGESKEDYYPDAQSPYEGYNSNDKINDLNSFQVVSEEIKKDPRKDPLVSLNLLNFQF
jgi:hypothetical protein